VTTGVTDGFQGHIPHEPLLQIFAAGESTLFEHIGNAPIEALNHAAGSGLVWFGMAVFNAQGLAQMLKLVV
jgi:hypothetical protein